MGIDIKECLTKSQLANQYNVSRKTMSKWLEKLGSIGKPFNGYFFTPRQVNEIYQKLDSPDFEKDDL
jgi:hypothetical protein